MWIGATHPAGYGVIERREVGKRKVWLAHRYVWSLLVGEPGRHLHHRCGVKPCVNPDHLESVTIQEHNQRHEHSSEHTHCKHGHEFTPENTYVRKDGGAKQCRRCKADREVARYAAMSPEERAARVAYISERRRVRVSQGR